MLGQLEVVDDRRPVPLAQGKRRALLALLLLNRNEVVPADRLIDTLWAGSPPPTAAKGLQVQISQLRKDLAPRAGTDGAALHTRGSGYVLEVDAENFDVARFERGVDDGRRALEEGRPEEAAALLGDALALWRGPALVDFAYDDFAQPEIARLDALRLSALEERFDAELALGRHRYAIPELETLLHAHPLRERLRGQLMLALHRSGRRAEALDLYREGRARSVEDLGLEPGAELRALEARILEDDPAIAAPSRVHRHAKRAARRAPVLLAAGGIVLALAAGGALLRESAAPSAGPAALADLAANTAASLSADGARVAFAAPLPGRPTDLAADGDRLLAVSVDSPALTVLDARTRTIAKQIPLPIEPGAVAAAAGGTWVADRRRGVVVRLTTGYARVAQTMRWPRRRAVRDVGPDRRDPTGVAVAEGTAWITDGDPGLVTVAADGRVARLPTRRPLDGVTAGAGAVWAISAAGASVVRIDPRARRVTDIVPIAGRPGGEAPAPLAIAAAHDAVWVLNANTATVTRIDARDRDVTQTIRLSIERGPRDIAVAAGAVWVANFDGSLTRIDRDGQAKLFTLGHSLVGVAGDARRLWVATTALDQQLPGGTG